MTFGVLLGAVAPLASGCSTATERVASTHEALDTICGEAPTASIDGIPALAYCGNFNVFSNNGIDTRNYGGPGWVQTEAGYGYQCFELASRYMHFKWGIDPNWGVLYASQMCAVHPPGVSVTTTPRHGDLAVFAGGKCGIAAPAGHVAVVDAVSASTFTAVQQNVAASVTWANGCESCFLHAASNGGVADPCAISQAAGDNCGATSQFPGGIKGTLYSCAGGVTTRTTKCGFGCSLQPAGVSDRCNEPPDPCAISQATRDNCGATSQFPGGTKDTLYSCAGGVTRSTTKCGFGCSLQPAGMSDRCNDRVLEEPRRSSDGANSEGPSEGEPDLGSTPSEPPAPTQASGCSIAPSARETGWALPLLGVALVGLGWRRRSRAAAATVVA